MAQAKFKFDLGVVLRDKVSGFEGACTARYEFLNGCRRYTICAEIAKPGDDLKEYTFDEQQLVKVKQGKKSTQGDTGGSRPTPPRTGH